MIIIKQKQKLLKKERLQKRMTHDKNDSQNNNTPHPDFFCFATDQNVPWFFAFSINSKFLFAKIPWIRYHDHCPPVPGVRFLGRRYRPPMDGFRQTRGFGAVLPIDLEPRSLENHWHQKKETGHGLSPSFWKFRRKKNSIDQKNSIGKKYRPFPKAPIAKAIWGKKYHLSTTSKKHPL